MMEYVYGYDHDEIEINIWSYQISTNWGLNTIFIILQNISESFSCNGSVAFGSNCMALYSCSALNMTPLIPVMICRMLSAMQISKSKLTANVPYLVIRPQRLNWVMFPLHIFIAHFSVGTTSYKLVYFLTMLAFQHRYRQLVVGTRCLCHIVMAVIALVWAVWI